MWSYISKSLSYEKPPFPCASPLRVVNADDTAQAQKVSDEVFAACENLFNDKKWTLGAYSDPDEGGDLKLFTQHAIGTFHLVKAVMSIQNTTPEKIIEVMHPDNFEDRQKFSADLNAFQIISRPTKDINIQHLGYYAPPPVAARDMCFLVSTKKLDDGSVYVYGCSIDCPQVPKNNGALLVRAASMWAWHILPVGPHCLTTYVNCFDPKGWTPRFVIKWLAYSVANELRVCRGILQGKDMRAKKIALEDMGFTKEELEEKEKE